MRRRLVLYLKMQSKKMVRPKLMRMMMTRAEY